MAYSIDIAQLNVSPILPEQPSNAAVAAIGSSSGQATSEQAAADAVGGVITGGTHDGVSVVYDSGDRTLDITNTDKGSVAVTAHEALLDPHPQYETAAEVAAQIATHSGATDPHGDRAFATAADAAHVAASDPHGDRAFATAADSAAISAHNAASDPHGDRAFATSAIATHSAATDPHGDRSYTDAEIAALAGYVDSQDAATLAAANAYTDAEVASALTGSFLPLAGGTLTGGLTVDLPNASIELGDISGSVNTPYIDFHSSNNANDYDARILASGGSASVGQGSLSVIAAQVGMSGAQDVTGQSRAGAQFQAFGWLGSPQTIGAGHAVEVGSTAGIGVMLSYNRTASTYGRMLIEGSQVEFIVNGAPVGAALNVSGSAVLRVDKGSGNGYADLTSGDTTHTGYTGFFLAAGRSGYIGYATGGTGADDGAINYSAAGHYFTGGVYANGYEQNTANGTSGSPFYSFVNNPGASTATHYTGVIESRAYRDIYGNATIAAIAFKREPASGGLASAGTIQFRNSTLGTPDFISCPVTAELDSNGRFGTAGGLATLGRLELTAGSSNPLGTVAIAASTGSTFVSNTSVEATSRIFVQAVGSVVEAFCVISISPGSGFTLGHVNIGTARDAWYFIVKQI